MFVFKAIFHVKGFLALVVVFLLLPACAPNQVNETADACATMQCPPDEVCLGGGCYPVVIQTNSSCAGMRCPEGQVCWGQTCYEVEVSTDPCQGMICGEKSVVVSQLSDKH